MSASEFTHSFIGHPVMAVLNLIGLRRAAAWVHDVALPMPEEPATACPHADRVDNTDLNALLEQARRKAESSHPVLFACQILDLQDGQGTLRLEWHEAGGSAGGAFAQTFGSAMRQAREVAMLLNGEQPVEPIIPDQTCEVVVEREWLWWIVKYRNKPGSTMLIVDGWFLFRSSAQAIADAIKAVHRDGVGCGAGERAQ